MSVARPWPVAALLLFAACSSPSSAGNVCDPCPASTCSAGLTCTAGFCVRPGEDASLCAPPGSSGSGAGSSSSASSASAAGSSSGSASATSSSASTGSSGSTSGSASSSSASASSSTSSSSTASSAGSSSSGSSSGSTASSAGSSSSGSSGSGSSGSGSSSGGSSGSGSTGGCATAAPGFETSVYPGMTVSMPYLWTFDPGLTTASGSFWSDGARLTTLSGPGPYQFTLAAGALDGGAHLFGHSWDLADGGHQCPTSGFDVTVVDPVDGGAYDQAISYTQVRPAFTPLRTVVVSTQSDLQNAVANLQPGDLVDCQGGFTVSGEFIINVSLTGTAVIDLKTGANAVKFVDATSQNLPALWLKSASNLRIYGGDFTTQSTGGACVLIYGADHLVFWGFYIHDCGGTGLSIQNLDAIVSSDFQGEITNAGQNTAWDPNAEKGTDLHGAALAGSRLPDGGPGGDFANNRIALYVHDQPTGSAVFLGAPAAPVNYGGNTLFLKAVNLTKAATSWPVGSAIELWGARGLGLDVNYLEAVNLQGRAVEGNGLYTDAGAGVVVHNGTASSTCLNPNLPGIDGLPADAGPWDPRKGLRYLSVVPAP